MSEDNNPFRPALAHPVDDSVLANDPAADNFLAGNDGLKNQVQRNMDGVMPANNQTNNQAIARLDQMAASNVASSFVNNNDNQMPVMGNAKFNTSATDIGNSNSTTPLPNNMFGALSAQPAESTIKPEGKKTKKAKRSLLSKKKKSDKTSKATGESVFGSLSDSLDMANLHVDDPVYNNEINDKATDSDNLSSISASLAVAADMADSKTTNTAANADNKVKTTKANQPKQLTISMLTIVFALLFLVASGVAVYFGYQNNENSTQLSSVQAELQQLKDETNYSSTSTNKTSTQFDALQDRIAELTKQNEEKQQTIDGNTTTINDLNKKNSELTNQLTVANNKLASDTQVSENIKSLIITMCADPEFSGSAACVQTSGGQQPANNAQSAE